MKRSQSLLTFPEADKSPLSIRAKALVFFDPRSHRVRDAVERLAPGVQPVLIRGETGTGKELLARHIHRASERAGLFVAVSCSALSRNYAEAELFGYAPGAHNGPVGSRAGWFGSAQGGTLYLDEIADLPLTLQEKLLRVLQEHEVLRVGAREPLPADVRLVAATSIDLAQAVAAGKFLEGLQQYLEGGSLELPPLRERPGDILPLAQYFLGVHAQRLALAVPEIDTAAQEALESYPWPGNIRELENVIHFALLVSPGATIGPQQLNFSSGAPLASLTDLQRLLRLPGAAAQVRAWLAEAERQAAP